MKHKHIPLDFSGAIDFLHSFNFLLTHHCMIQPRREDSFNGLGVNEFSIIEKDAPKCQKYKLEKRIQT